MRTTEPPLRSAVRSPLTVVDVGARGGLHPRWTERVSPLKAVLFEPDPKSASRLKEELGDKHIVLETALSDRAGELKLHLLKLVAASSVYEPDLEILGRYYRTDEFETVETITVPANTLDDELRGEGLFDVDFVKVDVQGHELAVLRGAANTLERVIGIEAEVEFVPVYKGQPLFEDVDRYVRSMGFELIDIGRTHRTWGATAKYGHRRGQLVWGDALYLRTPDRVLSFPDLTEGKVLRAIEVYLAYGYPDMGRTLAEIATERGVLSDRERRTIDEHLERFEVRRTNPLPKFWGKRTVYRIFKTLADVFRHNQRPRPERVDGILGNPWSPSPMTWADNDR